MFTRTFALILAGLVSSAAFGATENQETRFTKWLDALEKPLSQSDKKKEAAKAFLKDNSTRIAAFNLQALGRVYSDLDPEFEKIRKHAKNLEDGWGAVDKWKNLGKAKKADEARDQLADVLKEDDWIGDGESPRIQKMRKFLANFEWPSARKEKTYVAEHLAQQLSKVNQAEFDFHNLEEGNGLHELRRELRWFLIEARVVNGLVQFKEGRSCPARSPFVELLNNSIANSKFSDLPDNAQEANPCRVSKCLFLGAVYLVDEFGKLKDEAEKQGRGHTDVVPKELRFQAEQLYKIMVKSGLLPDLIEEVNACR